MDQEHQSDKGNPVEPMPVFVMFGKDLLASEAVTFYRDICLREGLTEQADEVTKSLKELEDYKDRNPSLMKMPDHKHMPARNVE